jgi:hypothetical protein
MVNVIEGDCGVATQVHMYCKEEKAVIFTDTFDSVMRTL